MSMIDIAVTRGLISALKDQRPTSRGGTWCWCPTGWPADKGHTAPCVAAREAIYQARKAGY